MNRPRLPRAGSKQLITRAGVVAALSAFAAAGLAAPAHSVAVDACPPTAPSEGAVGDVVHGLTVSQGTNPEPFTGTELGVLTDGIAPGLDLIMVRLSSPAIDSVGGVWEGMSGSPVYDSNDNLLGAVSYGLVGSTSPVVGLTPAAAMKDLLTSESPAKTALRTHVKLSSALQKKVVSSGAATAAQASAGLNQLELPFSVSGISSAQRMKQVSKLFNLPNTRMVPAGAPAPSGTTPGDPGQIFPGSNIAASMSYGDATAAAVGTTTAVCGSQVLAFGHYFNFTGPSSYTMHAANALYIQEDPLGSPMKISNLGDQVGEFTGDHAAGIVGPLGVLPPTWDVTSDVTVGAKQRTGTTHITDQGFFSDIATTHLLIDEDRLFDGIGKGSGSLEWHITGTRQDGTPFSLTRADRYADPEDLTFDTALQLNDVLSTLQYNGFEDITLTGVTTTSNLTRDYDHYTISKLERKLHGAWHRVRQSRTLGLQAGTTAKLRVTLTSQLHGTKTVRVDTPVPARAAGSYGYLEVFGGDTGSGGGDGFFAGRHAARQAPAAPQKVGAATADTKFDALLTSLRGQPHNVDVVSDLSILNDNGDVTQHRQVRVDAGDVVDGDLFISVHASH